MPDNYKRNRNVFTEEIGELTSDLKKHFEEAGIDFEKSARRSCLVTLVGVMCIAFAQLAAMLFAIKGFALVNVNMWFSMGSLVSSVLTCVGSLILIPYLMAKVPYVKLKNEKDPSA